MKRIIPLLFLPFIFFSCGEQNDKSGNGTDSLKTNDQFRSEVNALRKAGLLSKFDDHAIDSLIKQYSTDSLNGLKEILVRSGELFKVNCDLNGRSPLDVYAHVFDTIMKHYPDLVVSDFSCHYDKDHPGGKDSSAIRIMCRINSHPYSKVMLYEPNWPIDEYLYKMFNNAFADDSADERFYLIQFGCKYCNLDNDFLGNLDVSHFGLMRLKQHVADSIMDLEDLEMEPVNEFDIFNSTETAQTLSDLESTGLISKEMEHWNELKKQEVNEGFLYSYEDLCDFYDTLFYTASFDTIFELNPYSDMLTYMSEISRGAFKPTGISDQHATPVTHTFRFTLNGKIYENDFSQNGELFDPSIIDKVNDALEEQKVEGRFYTVYSRDNIAILVFIFHKDLEKVKASGFFPELEPGSPLRLRQKFASLEPANS